MIEYRGQALMETAGTEGPVKVVTRGGWRNDEEQKKCQTDFIKEGEGIEDSNATSISLFSHS